jgi:phosphocarrier protein
VSAAASECFEDTFTVSAELGLHARPAGQFVALAGRFDASIEVSRADDSEWVEGTSILSLLSLAAGHGTALRIRASGPDAAQAVKALGELLEEGARAAEPAS